MSRIAHARDVSKALRTVRVAVQKALKGTNKFAGQRISKGDYATAESLMSKAKEIRDFQSELDAVLRKWRQVCAAPKPGRTDGNQATTPLWQYYQPILRGLLQLGGESERPALEARIHDLMASSFLPGDNLTMAHGRERWRNMIRRARKHLIAEGWIEKRSGPVWKITDSGRQMAERTVSKETVN